MALNHTVKQGDCIESIAFKYGFFWEDLWNHPNNADLKNKRKDHNILFDGDTVFIPDKNPKTFTLPTGRKHKIMRKGVPSILRFTYLGNEEKPKVGVAYKIIIDGKEITGKTDSSGRIEIYLSPASTEGKLIIIDGDDKSEYTVLVGHLDPVDTITGVQSRLNSLGFYCGNVDGILGPMTKNAILMFQKKQGLVETGELDGDTKEKLKEVHHC